MRFVGLDNFEKQFFGSEQFPRVSFTVFNGPTPDTLAVLYESARAEGHEPAHSGLTQLQIAGGMWTVRYASQPQFVWGHEWQLGDTLIWDNQCLIHRRDPFDASARRMLHRVQLRGGRPQ